MVDLLDVFGRVAHAEFIKAGVVDLPEISAGKSALSLLAIVKRLGADALPVGYGREFAGQVRQGIARCFRQADVVEEAMLTVVTTAVRGRFFLSPGSHAYAARRYVFTAGMNAAKNVLRTRWRRQRHEVPFGSEPTDDVPRQELADPRSLNEQERAVAAADVSVALFRLNQLDPRACAYVRARLEGKSVVTMAREWDVPGTTVDELRRLVDAHLSVPGRPERGQSRALYFAK